MRRATERERDEQIGQGCEPNGVREDAIRSLKLLYDKVEMTLEARRRPGVPVKRWFEMKRLT
ncbi:hypothetical protein BIWAKO_05993 [Bosea sp. BIWAKO-01]|nr:hypothetical protein BIWAKO_05993 [Bosea sp. BIWAKO-01]